MSSNSGASQSQVKAVNAKGEDFLQNLNPKHLIEWAEIKLDDDSDPFETT
jgi:hypothetical protein